MTTRYRVSVGVIASERQLREAVTSGGLTRVRRATATPLNRVFPARP